MPSEQLPAETASVISVADFAPADDDDGPRFQAAADYAAAHGRKTILVPSIPAGYSVRTTVELTTHGHWGLRWVGEGGRSTGEINTTTTVWCDVAEKHGLNARVGAVAFSGTTGNYYTVRVDGLAGLTGADVGKFLRLVGSAKDGNDGRFMIVKIITDDPKVPAGSACLIFKTPAGTNPAVADDPNNDHIDWRVEECAFDVRARGTVFEHLTFMVRPGRTITRMVNVTESPEPDSMGLTHVKFADCCFTSQLITGANARWGVTLAELVLPKPGKVAIYQEENGVPRPYQPPNCDFVSFADCYFDGLQEAGVAHCNSPDGGGVIPAVSPGQNPVTRGGGGQSREHLFFRSEFGHMPFGYYTLPDSFGMARFEQCTWDNITDTGVVLRNGVNVLTISGGLTEKCARLVDYEATGFCPVVIEDIAFGVNADSAHPSNEMMTFRGVGPFLFKNVFINTTNLPDPYISMAPPSGQDGGTERFLTLLSCQFQGHVQHPARSGGYARLIAARRGPFPLANGMTLIIQSTFNGPVETVTFNDGTRPDGTTPLFADRIARATATEAAAVINTQLTLNKVRAFGTGDNLLALESTTPGNDTHDALFGLPGNGGTANAVFGFPDNGNYKAGNQQSGLAKLTGGFFASNGDAPCRVVLMGNAQYHTTPQVAADPFEDGIFHVDGVTGHISHGFSTRELSGSADITGAQTTATVRFSRPEPDTGYLPAVSPGPAAGVPAPGALRASWANKTLDGFDINLEAAPGSSGASPNAVHVTWHLLR